MTMVGVLTLATRLVSDRCMYCSVLSQGFPGNQYCATKGMSEVSTKLYQLMTG